MEIDRIYSLNSSSARMNIVDNQEINDYQTRDKFRNLPEIVS